MFVLPEYVMDFMLCSCFEYRWRRGIYMMSCIDAKNNLWLYEGSFTCKPTYWADYRPFNDFKECCIRYLWKLVLPVNSEVLVHLNNIESPAYLQSSTLAVVRWPMTSENGFGPVTLPNFFNRIYINILILKFSGQ